MNDIFEKTLLQLAGNGETEAEFIPLITSEEEKQMNSQDFPDELPILPLRNNVLFGLNPLKYKDQDIIDLLEKLNLKKFLKNISYNLNTKISENGLNVSGGEIQRIGIARALIYKPEFVILDEATSGLDSKTESKIFEEVLAFNKTFLIVTHNKNLIKYCQKVIDLNNK